MIEAARAHLAPGLLAFSLLAGCGLKGPLHLPDKADQAATPSTEAQEQTPKRRTAPRPAPQSQKEDAARSQEPPPAPSDPDRSANPPPTAPPPRL
jgi:predicted small lipoprotein YifL